MNLSNINIIGSSVFNSFAQTTAPVQYGILGQQANLPNNDFLHSGGNRVLTWFEADKNASITNLNIRLRSGGNPANQMNCGIYTMSNENSGFDFTLAPEVLNFGNAETVLSFNISKTINASVKYGFSFQASSDWYFYYDSSLLLQYCFLNSAGFGVWDSSFSGASNFNNLFQTWANYEY